MPNLYVIAAIVAIVGGVYLKITMDGRRIEALLLERDRLAGTVVQLQAERDAQKILDEARTIRETVARNQLMDDIQRTERQKARANENKVAETSARDAEKYTRVAHKMLERNIELLTCRSDLRNIHDKNPCPGTVR